MTPIDQMRLNYDLAGLDVSDVHPDPLVQFELWFAEARGDLATVPPDWLEVNAMTLSTCDYAGRISSRIVLLKEVADGSFVFFTNYRSAKAQQLHGNAQAALCFYWPHVQRQVRIEGRVEKISRERSEAYFHSRPRDSQLGAHVSPQSEVVASRDVLEASMKNLRHQFPDGSIIPLPEHWGGYGLAPELIEFWQGRASRLHDRIVYRRDPSSWRIQRLAP